jgi:hypothetical protein
MRVEVETPFDTWFTAHALTGLFELEARREIELQVRPGFSEYRRGMYALAMTVTGEGSSRRVLLDVKDAPGAIDERWLRDYDVIFQRSFEPVMVEGLMGRVSRESRCSKIEPMGLTFSCASRHSRADRLLSAAPYAHLIKRFVRDGVDAGGLRERFARLRWDISHTRRPQSRPLIDTFVDAPGPTEPMVMFITRRFEPDSRERQSASLREDKVAVNEQRVELVAKLREAFGSRFVGGIMADGVTPSLPAKWVAPTLKREMYLRVMRRARVVVYSRGLVGSLAFKLGEYFAASRCIVAERTTFRLAEPWVDGEDLVTFGEPDQCVRLCRELVDDPVRAAVMSQAAHRYYQRAVEPAAAMRRILATALR